MILYSHPTGNANVRHTAQALAEGGLLTEFWTCLNYVPEAAWTRLLPKSITRQMARRAFPEAVREYIHTSPAREFGRLLAPKLKLSQLLRHETGPLSVDAVFRDLDRRVAARLPQSDNVRAVWAGEDGASETFQQAAHLGLTRLYDLPIGYWRAGQAVYAEEREREPEWAATLSGTRDSPTKLARKDEELARADVIFVASTYTRETLKLYPGVHGPVHIIPYGAPPVSDAPRLQRSPGAPLRVLFVGSLSQRKGLSYLLKAIDMMQGGVELTLIGTRPGVPCAPLDAALRRHRWRETLPHAEVLGEMRRADVLVFPSLFEGFGLVILEAMSQGLPVITTDRTAGPDILTDGVDGFLVPIRDPETIAEKLSLLRDHPDRLDAMSRAAWETARHRSWDGYHEAIQRVARAALHETVGAAA